MMPLLVDGPHLLACKWPTMQWAPSTRHVFELAHNGDVYSAIALAQVKGKVW
jgi:hypothetical protein